MNHVQFKGIIPPVLTIMNADGSFDWEGTKRLIDHDIAAGVHGLFILGSSGEFVHMSTEERMDFAEFAVKHVNKRVPVLIGTGGCSTTEVIQLTQHAREIGADGVGVVSPYYWLLDENELYHYYASIARKVDIPIMIYHIPMATGQQMSASLIARLATDFSNIVGIKDTIDSIAHLRQIINKVKRVRPDFSVLTGFDDHIFNTMVLGGDGAITGCTNFVPEITVSIYNHFVEGRLSESLNAYRKLQQINQIYDLGESIIGVLKEACKQVLGINNCVRPPVTPCSQTSAEEVKLILTEAGVLK